jgi:hypothetical protein
MPAVQLDQIGPFVAAALLTQGADDGGEPAGLPILAQIGPLQMRLDHGVDRVRLGDDDVGWRRRQHLRQQGRAAARRVEDEPARLQVRSRGEPGGDRLDRRHVTNQSVERRAQAGANIALEKRIAQMALSEIRPIGVEFVAMPWRGDRQPAVRRQTRCRHFGVERTFGAEFACAHGGVNVIRDEDEAALARGLQERGNEGVGVGGPSQRLLQRKVFK